MLIQGAGMRRREFLGIFAGAAVAWPFTVSAQQQTMPVIGFVSSLTPGDAPRVTAAFQQGLSEIGYVEGRNVAIEYRWASGQYDRLPMLVGDLLHHHVAVIAAISGTPTALAAKAATTTIPIVFAIGGDRVAPGLVTSLNRPSGNVTGVTFFTAPVATKRLELLRALAPKSIRIGVLANPRNPPSALEAKSVPAAARAIGLQATVLNASNKPDIDDAFATMVEQQINALFVSADPMFLNQRDQLVALSMQHAVVTIYADREIVEAGGLISYGASRSDAYRQAGNYGGFSRARSQPACQ